MCNPLKNVAKTFGLGALMLATVANGVQAAELKDNAEVFARLLNTAIANEIREKCNTIAAREIRAGIYVLGIVSYAKKQGFSMDEIEAYRRDPVEQERLRAAGYAYLDSHGVNRDENTGYCELGRAEMSAKSQIGRLLKNG